MCKKLCECVCGCALKLLRFVFAVIPLIFFLGALGPYSATLSGTPPTPGQFSYLGTSVLLAGIGGASSAATENGISISSVYWLDLNTANTCQNGTDVFELWAKPTGVCYACSEGYCYGKPMQVQAQQAILLLAIIFAGLLSIWRLVAICCTINCICTPIDIILSLILISFGAASFAIWKTYPMASTLQSDAGGRVPVFETILGSTTLTVSPVVQMGISTGFNLMVTGFFFSLVAAVLACIPDDCGMCRPKKEKKHDHDEEQPAGCCACCAATAAAKEAPKEAPAAAPAAATPAEQPTGCLACCGGAAAGKATETPKAGEATAAEATPAPEPAAEKQAVTVQ